MLFRTRLGVCLILLFGSALAVAQQRATVIMSSPVPLPVQAGATVDYDFAIIPTEELDESQAGPPEVTSSSTPPSGPTLADLITTLPIARRASDVVRGKLLGADQMLAHEAAVQAAAVTESAPLNPPHLNVPSPEAYAAAQAAAQAREIARRAERFRLDVVLGDWPAVAAVMAELPAEQANRVFGHLLTSLAQPIVPVPTPSTNPLRPPTPRSEQPESQFVTCDDVLAIADLAPQELTDPQIAQLAALLQQAQAQGYSTDSLAARLDQGTRWLGGGDFNRRIKAAELFSLIGLHREALRFLPAFDALDRTHAKLLLTFGNLSQTLFAEDRKQQHLENAWQCYSAILEVAAAKREEKTQALEQLILLSPKVDKAVGEQWLQSGLQASGARPARILAALGERSLSGPVENPFAPAERLAWLQLQRQVVEQMFDLNSPSLAELSSPLSLLATAWLREAELAVNQAQFAMGNSYMQVDMYGNYYWTNSNQMAEMQAQQGMPQPIQLHELIECRPSERWTAQVAPDLQLAFPKMLVRLHLRADEEDKAFPYIEQVAARDPDATQALVDEFLTTWTQNHDPNNDRRMQNQYIYFYGFEQRADSIPLTRSKQQRNIAELSQWVARIRKLPLEKLDETALANAFTSCHSSAEVFQLSAIESVFGPVEQLKPEIIALLVGTMRSNLATVWRSVRTQEEKQTNRREPEIEREVLRGYEVSRNVVQRALEASPNHWRLLLARAALEHDAIDYQQSIQKSSKFSAQREAVLESFAEAARQYAAALPQLEKDQQATDVYDFWFYASLGAVDLGQITAGTVPVHRQFPRIRQAIEGLPSELAEDHMAKFANNLFARMSPLKPELKYRYLKAGFEIVGDHPRAIEARKLFQYYNDLISEIQLLATIDGTHAVGHKQPFGIYLSILHTPEIERESAGFAKYLQNQNAMQFAYNYGRPTEDYRDKFQKNVTEALSEHFEVLSIAFEDPKNMRSRETDQPGWRVTPYAYVVLKPLGPQVDKVPAVQLDLDFLDTSGYAVIPIHSAILPIDASGERVVPRPFAGLKLTQTLDERQASDGKLILEVKGTAQGLVPELDDIVDLRFGDFEVASVDEQPVLPTGFDPQASSIAILSDRSWTVALRPRNAEANARKFQFAKPKVQNIENTLQRYEDSDLVAAEPVVELQQALGRRSLPAWFWAAVPAALIGMIAFAWFAVARKPAPKTDATWVLPAEINPFTVLTLLKRIRNESPGGQRHREELDHSIAQLEQYYFGPTNGQSTPDLQSIARTWTAKAR